MTGFIVPVKPKQFSKNWELDNLLLERTSRSICNQDSDDFRLILVYTDKPVIHFSHPNLHYLHFPYPDVAVKDMADWPVMQKWYTPVFAERMMDKARKILFGCQLAKTLGCTYLMGVDSDDLVSGKLTSFINSYPDKSCPGWRINKGYVYEEDSIVAIKNKMIWGMNGSTHLIRDDLVEIPNFETDFNLFHYTLFQSHSYTYQRLLDYKKEKLEVLPFYGVIYLVHNHNYSGVKEIISANTFKLLTKKVLMGKLISKKLRKEFGLYPLPAGKEEVRS